MSGSFKQLSTEINVLAATETSCWEHPSRKKLSREQYWKSARIYNLSIKYNREPPSVCSSEGFLCSSKVAMNTAYAFILEIVI